MHPRHLPIVPVVVSLAIALSASADSVQLPDKGIFSDLDAQVVIRLPKLDLARLHATLSDRHKLVVLYEGDRPIKAYPIVTTNGPTGTEVTLGDRKLRLRQTDAAEVAPLLAGRPLRVLGPREVPPPGDRDGDGIPDPLDLFMGAKKVALNGAAYVGGYVPMKFPGGDVPREHGVCTDVIIRAMRNAGVDLQRELYLDIARAPRAYWMVKQRDANIDQRRVKTILPWFKRHWRARGTDPASKDDPFRPGDVVFMDTFPDRDGPDHVGIVSDTIGASGYPLVINNWTDGFKESEMDLLATVPVLQRFRIK